MESLSTERDRSRLLASALVLRTERERSERTPLGGRLRSFVRSFAMRKAGFKRFWSFPFPSRDRYARLRPRVMGR
jgi:hypothetical protein